MLTSYETRGGGFPIHVLKLRLSNFRNYSSLDLGFGRGITLIEGRNGQGKTNLLEAIYLMVIGRSPRSATDRRMVRAEAMDDFIAHAQVYGEVATRRGRVNLQVDLSSGAGKRQFLKRSRPIPVAEDTKDIQSERGAKSDSRTLPAY